ncbi:MAG: hypothetical protein MRY64_16655 [Hyphomonadaceae bacterium]|nr:hypothetical protein [Hyphomonadaceae bacterium]
MTAALPGPERRLTYGVIITLVVQFAAGFMWAGSAGERLENVEASLAVTRTDHVRLARVETKIEAISAQLDRIEHRLESQE